MVSVDTNGRLGQSSVRVQGLVGQEMPQVPVARARGSLVASGVTGRVDMQEGWRHKVRGRSVIGLLWEDHRDTLEDPLRVRGGGGGADEEEEEEGGKPAEKCRELR